VGDVGANLALTRRGYELWNTGGVQAMFDHVECCTERTALTRS
jgi:hypothetical protein